MTDCKAPAAASPLCPRNWSVLLVCSLLLIWSSQTSAASFNVTSVVQSPLAAAHFAPGDVCPVPGICSTVNQTLPGNTLYVWCGFYTTHRTVYAVTSYGKFNVTSQWMRRKTLMKCTNQLTQLGRLSNDTCDIIIGSACSSKSSVCNVRLFGLSFPDEMCLVVANNKASAATFSVRVNNYHDGPRTYGTAFALLFIIVGGAAILANVSMQVRKAWQAPISHRERVKMPAPMAPPPADTEVGYQALTGAPEAPERSLGAQLLGGLPLRRVLGMCTERNSQVPAT